MAAPRHVTGPRSTCGADRTPPPPPTHQPTVNLPPACSRTSYRTLQMAARQRAPCLRHDFGAPDRPLPPPALQDDSIVGNVGPRIRVEERRRVSPFAPSSPGTSGGSGREQDSHQR
ncbi:homeobox protein ARX-like [Gadus morhua]|uniref:homeobox protein ARX-like n=1 Tax=Gadus morhua TaxID=8049 RepID=UPI0011B4AE61|nr:homeobox protein ARX-like [Gadus morhua]